MRTLALLLFTTLACFGQGFSDASAPFLLSTSSLRRGLTGYWRLEETSGVRYDCSNTGAVLSSSNATGQAVGKVGNCASFVAASSQYLALPNTNTFQYLKAQPVTYCAWVKLTNTGTWQTILAKYQKSTEKGWHFLVNPSGVIYFEISSGGSAYAGVGGATTVTNGAWHCVVATYNGIGNTNGMSLYVDGNQEPLPVGSQVGSIPDINNAANFCIGNYTGATFLANGLIDEVGLWTRVLSTNEIAMLYNTGAGNHFPWAHR